ncbi:MAG: hypothetical protein E7566_00885 [Ruminococcaceae bacterium]|nr:hypothetical protein [Oscillospiraceae bacterium]
MKVILTLCLSFVIVFVSSLDVNAQNTEDSSLKQSIDELSDDLGLSEFYNQLPSETKDTFKDLGINSISITELSSVSFSSVINEIFDIGSKESKTVFSSLGLVIAVLLLYSLVEGFMQNITAVTMREVLSVVSTLCIACLLVIPITNVIDMAGRAIRMSCQFMLAFIPLMVTVIVSSGNSLSGAGYYSLMVFAAEGIAQLSSKFITPMLNVFLGVSICSTVVPQLKLQSITDLFSKTIKWLLSFSFTIFSALLTFRTLIATSIDSVSTRAVRFTMSSFIPVVGAALSEAYKTVQGSINILKNGMGVFVIFAVAFVFLPVVLRLLLWSFSINICKTVAEVLGISIPGRMLMSVGTVLSVLLAVVLCVMALFIISTALIITVGGKSS